MFTSQFPKPVVGTAIAAATLGQAALLAAGTAGGRSGDPNLFSQDLRHAVHFVDGVEHHVVAGDRHPHGVVAQQRPFGDD